MKAGVESLTLLLLSILFAAAAPACEPDATAGPADLVLTNGKLFPADGTAAFYEALAVCGNTIVAVGTTEQIERWRGPDTQVIDAGRRAVLPGFVDNHTHLMTGGRASQNADLRGAATLEEVQKRIRSFAAAHPENAWVQGSGWTYSAFPSLLPVRQQLDAVVPDRPAVMSGRDGHSSWVNSKALALAGIDKETPDPEGGTIVRDAAGVPTGVLVEGPATRLVSRVVPQQTRTREDDRRALKTAIDEANRAGVTSVTEAFGSPDGLALFDDARRAGELTLRVHYSLGVQPSFSEQDLRAMQKVWIEHPDTPTLKLGTAKLVLDGVTSARTAYMLAPYVDHPTNGAPFFTREQLERTTQMLDREGWQIMIHAIGDGAVRMALDALEKASAVNPVPERGRRHRIEHASFVDRADVPRFGQLGVILSRQGGGDFVPLDAQPEASTSNPTVANVGRERWAETGGILREIIAGGGMLTLGSDYYVAAFDPMGRISSLVNRPARPGGADQRISLEDAIRAYTTGSAYGSFRETQIGTLRRGMSADIVMLATDIFAKPPTKAEDVAVMMTIFDGRIVYRDGRVTN
jgi:predicted amidohydrolase YtcJ